MKFMQDLRKRFNKALPVSNGINKIPALSGDFRTTTKNQSNLNLHLKKFLQTRL